MFILSKIYNVLNQSSRIGQSKSMIAQSMASVYHCLFAKVLYTIFIKFIKVYCWMQTFYYLSWAVLSGLYFRRAANFRGLWLYFIIATHNIDKYYVSNKSVQVQYKNGKMFVCIFSEEELVFQLTVLWMVQAKYGWMTWPAVEVNNHWLIVNITPLAVITAIILKIGVCDAVRLFIESFVSL